MGLLFTLVIYLVFWRNFQLSFNRTFSLASVYCYFFYHLLTSWINFVLFVSIAKAEERCLWKILKLPAECSFFKIYAFDSESPFTKFYSVSFVLTSMTFSSTLRRLEPCIMLSGKGLPWLQCTFDWSISSYHKRKSSHVTHWIWSVYRVGLCNSYPPQSPFQSKPLSLEQTFFILVSFKCLR